MVNGINAEAEKQQLGPESFISKTMGRLNWLTQLNREAGETLMDKFRAAIESHRTLPVAIDTPLNITSLLIQEASAETTNEAAAAA